MGWSNDTREARLRPRALGPGVKSLKRVSDLIRIRVMLVAAVALGALAPSARAQPLAPRDVPPPLQPWIPWVLKGSEPQRCPVLPATTTTPRCAPGRAPCGWSWGRPAAASPRPGRCWPRPWCRCPVTAIAGRSTCAPAARAGGAGAGEAERRRACACRRAGTSCRAASSGSACPRRCRCRPRPASCRCAWATREVPVPARDQDGALFLARRRRRRDRAEPVEADRLEHRRAPPADRRRAGAAEHAPDADGGGQDARGAAGPGAAGGLRPPRAGQRAAGAAARPTAACACRCARAPGRSRWRPATRPRSPAIGRPAPDGPWKQGPEVWVFEARPRCGW